MTSPRGRLTAVTVACVVFGPAAMVAAWRSPESDGFTVLATAAGWPWAWAALEGGLVWRIQTKVMTTLFALFAEVERDLIAERTREGLARARASGQKLGRPKGSLGVSRFDGREDEIRRFLELGVSKTAIAKLTGVSPDGPVQLHEHAWPRTAPSGALISMR